jgi:hypothetical protein
LSSIVVVRDQVADWAAGFDASAYTVEQCQQIVSHATAMERMMGAVKAQAAARVAQTEVWKESGARSPAHALADATGTTVGAARETLQTGAAMATLPELAAAACRGKLSPAQSASLASVGVVARELVPALIDRAQQTSVAEFREECARTLAAREPDPEAKRAKIHAERELRSWSAPSGARVLQLTDTPDIVAAVITQIAPAREALYAQARERGETIRPEALDADALVATIHAGAKGRADSDDALPHRCAPRAKVLVRVDFDTLLRGYPIDGEICEIAGYGPIAVTAATAIITSGDAFLAAIVTQGQQVLGVSHYGRKALAHQATALEWINPTCAVDGCTQHTRLETDHRDPWANTKLTLLDLLDRLCDHHHDLKTRKNWALTPGHGKRPFVPPTDPRHPNNSRGDPTQK